MVIFPVIVALLFIVVNEFIITPSSSFPVVTLNGVVLLETLYTVKPLPSLPLITVLPFTFKVALLPVTVNEPVIIVLPLTSNVVFGVMLLL